MSGAFLIFIGLDKADKVSSVAGAFVGVIGLALGIFAMFPIGRKTQPTGGQSVARSVIGGAVTQVNGVQGSVRIQGAAYSSEPPPLPVGDDRSVAADGGQVVRDSSVAGPVRQIESVGGDVDLDP